MFLRNAMLVALATAAIGLTGCGSMNPLAQRAAPSETEQVAQAAYSVADYHEAARLYERAAEQNPRSAEALLGLGRSYMALGQFNRASNALMRARELGGQRAEVNNELGNLALMQMHPKEAIGFYDTALRADRNNLAALTGKAVSLDYLSRHAEAQKVYRQAIAHYPTNFALLNNYALSQVLSGQIGEGLTLMEELLRDPNRGDSVRPNMAIAYALEGRVRDARAMLEGTMSGAEIEETLAYYAKVREAYLAGKPVGYMIFS